MMRKSPMSQHAPTVSTEASAPVGTRYAPSAGRRARRRSFVPLWFALPAIALYLWLVLWPSLQGVSLSFTDWNGMSPDKEFVGFKNFIDVFSLPDGVGAVGRTLIIAGSLLVIQNVGGLLLALALNTRIRSKSVLRTVFFAPAVLSAVVLGYTFKFIFAPLGPLNEFLLALGVQSPPNWLGQPELAVVVIIFVIAWQSTGSTMIIYLAGLQSVPQDLIEAASIDGAGAFRRFSSVTLPHLAPAITVNFVLTLIAGLRVFDQVYVMTGGGPANSTQTISTLLIQQAFKFMNYGYGAALAVVLSVLIAVLSLVQFTVLRRQRSE